MAVSRPNVELHIEELVLHGFAPGGRHAIAAALESELTRLLAANGLPDSLAAGSSIPSLQVGSFTVEPGSPPGAVGAQLAHSLHQGMSQ